MSLKKLKDYLFLTSFFLFIGTLAASSTDVRIELSLTIGEDYKFKTTTNQVSYETVNGVEQDVKRNLTFEYVLTPKRKDSNSNFYAQLKFTRITLEIIADGFTSSFDSKINANQNLSFSWMKSNAALVNSTFDLILSNSGEIIEIKDNEQLMNKAASLVFDQKEEIGKQIREALLNTLSISTLKQMLEMSIVSSPEFSIYPRSFWTNSESVTNLITLKYANGFIVKSIDNNEIIIDLMSTIAAFEVDKKVVNGSEVTYKLLGSTVGSLTVKRNLGLVSNFESTQKISGTVTSYVNGVKKELPLDVEIRTKTERIK